MKVYSTEFEVTKDTIDVMEKGKALVLDDEHEDHGFFVTVQSFDETLRHEKMRSITNKRIRVTVEIVQ